jgi:hypothetical protein
MTYLLCRRAEQCVMAAEKRANWNRGRLVEENPH